MGSSPPTSIRGDYDRALECYERQLSLAEELGNRSGVSLAIGNIGVVYCDRDEYDRGLECYDRQLNIARELGDRRIVSYAIGNMGVVYSRRGEYDRALEHFHNASGEHRAIGVRDALSEWLQETATVLLEITESAKEMPEYLPKYVSGVTEETWQAMSLQRARECAEESVAISEELQKPDTLFGGRVLLARIEATEGRVEGAVEQLGAMLSEASEDEQRTELHYWLWKIGPRTEEIGQKEEDRVEALRLYTELYAKVPKYDYQKKIDELLAATNLPELDNAEE